MEPSSYFEAVLLAVWSYVEEPLYELLGRVAVRVAGLLALAALLLFATLVAGAVTFVRSRKPPSARGPSRPASARD